MIDNSQTKNIEVAIEAFRTIKKRFKNTVSVLVNLKQGHWMKKT